MNFDEYAASFEGPESYVPEALAFETKAKEVVVVGTIKAASKESCFIDVNGAIYEVARRDIIDIDPIPRLDSEEETQEDVESDDEASGSVAQIALVKVTGDAVLHRRIGVPAVFVAAAGTWVSVVPSVTEAA